jgi:hypothetical protein
MLQIPHSAFRIPHFERRHQGIQPHIRIVHVVDLLDRLKVAQPDLHAIGPALFQVPVVVTFSVSHAMAHAVETQSGDQYHVDTFGFDKIIVRRLVYAPGVSYKLGLMCELQTPDTIGLRIDTWYDRLDLREIAPELDKDKSRVDLFELFDRDKGVEKADSAQIETGEEVIGDPPACRVPLFFGHRFLFRKILPAKLSLVH